MLEWKVMTPQLEATNCVHASEAGQLVKHQKIYFRQTLGL